MQLDTTLKRDVVPFTVKTTIVIMPKEVYEVFLSSTSYDLQDYRKKVHEMLDRFGLATIKMETFGAQPSVPFETCRLRVQSCDALIVIVGNRYGWIPRTEDGGDDIRSITWWEVSWALEAKKPVYAFLCDLNTKFNMETEQDRLLAATDEAMFLKIGKSVLNLKKFREFLETKTSRETFFSVDDLAAKVTTSISAWILDLAIQRERSAMQKEKSIVKEEKLMSIGDPGTGSKQSNVLFHSYEQIYWQELVHLSSAKCLPVINDENGIALIAGRANLKHPALVHNSSIREIDARLNKTDPNNPDDYTTALAALLVGSSNDDSDYTGVLPNAKLSIYQVLTASSTHLPDLLAAIKVAILEGNKVICLPLGGAAPSKKQEKVHRDAADKGVIIVSAAGNESSQKPMFPAGYGYGINVASTSSYNLLANFSNYGDGINSATPGVGIPVAKANNGYGAMSGTSFSCAIAAGIILMMVSANKDLTITQVKQILKSTGQIVRHPTGLNIENEIRLMDAFQAVQSATQLTVKASSSLTGNSGNKKPVRKSKGSNAAW